MGINCKSQITSPFPMQKKVANILYEVIPIRLFLIVMLVFYHAFAVFSGAWTPIAGYPDIPIYGIVDKLSCACLLETFVFISGYILGYQVSRKGVELILNAKSYFMKKLKRLILPSILFSILYVLIFNDSNESIQGIAYNVLSGAGHMWFLPMLFWCFVFVYLTERFLLSKKCTIALLPLMLLASFLPLPFRIDTAMYYFPFFYSGYYIKKYGLEIKHGDCKSAFALIACFILAFVLKINIEGATQNGGGYFALSHIISLIISKLIRFACAAFGVALLLTFSTKLVKHSDTSKWSFLLKLSDCCFGVYIFQQFILILIGQTKLSQNVNPYLYPWIAFAISLVTSLLLTVFVRKTKFGSQLM